MVLEALGGLGQVLVTAAVPVVDEHPAQWHGVLRVPVGDLERVEGVPLTAVGVVQVAVGVAGFEAVDGRHEGLAHQRGVLADHVLGVAEEVVGVQAPFLLAGGHRRAEGVDAGREGVAEDAVSGAGEVEGLGVVVAALVPVEAVGHVHRLAAVREAAVLLAAAEELLVRAGFQALPHAAGGPAQRSVLLPDAGAVVGLVQAEPQRLLVHAQHGLRRADGVVRAGVAGGGVRLGGGSGAHDGRAGGVAERAGRVRLEAQLTAGEEVGLRGELPGPDRVAALAAGEGRQIAGVGGLRQVGGAREGVVVHVVRHDHDVVRPGGARDDGGLGVGGPRAGGHLLAGAVVDVHVEVVRRRLPADRHRDAALGVVVPEAVGHGDGEVEPVADGVLGVVGGRGARLGAAAGPLGVDGALPGDAAVGGVQYAAHGARRRR